jgi:hypothetical protein
MTLRIVGGRWVLKVPREIWPAVASDPRRSCVGWQGRVVDPHRTAGRPFRERAVPWVDALCVLRRPAGPAGGWMLDAS